MDARRRGEPRPGSPLVVVAPRTATNPEALVAEHGTVLGHWAGEDATIRGEAERGPAPRPPGPPVQWNEDGTVRP